MKRAGLSRDYFFSVSPHSPSPFIHSLQTAPDLSFEYLPSLAFAKNTTVLQSTEDRGSQSDQLVGLSENQATRKEALLFAKIYDCLNFLPSFFVLLAQDVTIFVTCSLYLNKSSTFLRAALHDPWSGDPRTIPVSANQAISTGCT